MHLGRREEQRLVQTLMRNAASRNDFATHIARGNCGWGVAGKIRTLDVQKERNKKGSQEYNLKLP
jgi:hypothetical protein